MEWDRAELLHKLRLVQPALAKPQAGVASGVFENIWLRDGTLIACNDTIGLTTTGNEGGPVGGVNGERLIKLLKNTSAETVSLTNSGGRLLITGDRFNADLSADEGDPPLAWPQVEDGTPQIEVGDAFVTGCILAKSLIDPHAGSFKARGMTLNWNQRGVSLYATSQVAGMRVALGPHPEMQRPLQTTLTLPFIEQVIKQAPGWLTLADSYALFDSNDIGLWGRYTLDERESIDLDAGIKRRWPKTIVELPPGFRKAVLRSGAMAEREGRVALAEMRVHPKGLVIRSRSAPGGIEDKLEPFAHPPQRVMFDQRLIERLPKSIHKLLTHLGVTESAITFTSEDHSIVYMNATQQVSKF